MCIHQLQSASVKNVLFKMKMIINHNDPTKTATDPTQSYLNYV